MNPPSYEEFDNAPSYDELDEDSDSNSEVLNNPGQLDRRFSDSQNGTIYNIKRAAVFANKFDISYAENNEKVYVCKPRKTFAVGGMMLLNASDDRPLCQTKKENIFSVTFSLNYLAKSPFKHPEIITVKRERTIKLCYTFEWERKIKLTWRHKGVFELRCRLNRTVPEASTSTNSNNFVSSSATKKQEKSERTYVAFYQHHTLGPAQLRIIESMFDGLIEDKQGCYHMLILSAIYIRVLLQSKNSSG